MEININGKRRYYRTDSKKSTNYLMKIKDIYMVNVIDGIWITLKTVYR